MNPPDGAAREIVCPHCQERIDVLPGGWAYVYTQVRLHLERCARDLSEEERRELARSLVGDGDG